MAETEREGSKNFEAMETVNGIAIEVYQSNATSNKGEYEIQFPQIEIGDVARERGVDDQVIRISENPETAKKVFEFAKKIAESAKDVYAVYLAVQDFCRGLDDSE